MKAHRFKANGLVLNCVDYGGEGKQPMLFLHGGSAHAHWWDFVAPAFVGDFHVLALDQRGHGESEWADEWAYGSRHYVSDLDQVIDALGVRRADPGWSFNGRAQRAGVCVGAQRKAARDRCTRPAARLHRAGSEISAVSSGEAGAKNTPRSTRRPAISRFCRARPWRRRRFSSTSGAAASGSTTTAPGCTRSIGAR